MAVFLSQVLRPLSTLSGEAQFGKVLASGDPPQSTFRAEEKAFGQRSPKLP
jgi:hypothetical protein